MLRLADRFGRSRAERACLKRLGYPAVLVTGDREAAAVSYHLMEFDDGTD